jgi:hypothetical protein
VLPGAPVRAPWSSPGAYAPTRPAGGGPAAPSAGRPPRPARTSITRHLPSVTGILRTATEGGASAAAKTSYSRQSFGVRSAHAGRDMPESGTRSARSFSAADLRPADPRHPADTPGTERRKTRRNGPRTPAHNSPEGTRRHNRRARNAPPRERDRRRAGRDRAGAPGRRRPGTHGPGGGPTPPGPVRHPRGLWQRNSPARRARQAAWRQHGPAHGSTCNRPPPPRHRAHGQAHGHMYREHDRTPVQRATRTFTEPPRTPREGSAGASPAVRGRLRRVSLGGTFRAIYALAQGAGFAPSDTRHLTVGRRRTTLGVPGSHPSVRLGTTGSGTALAANGPPWWLNRLQGGVTPRTPPTDQARRPAPSGITR